MENKFPQITAKNSKEFSELEQAIKTLPPNIIEGIKRVENGLVGIECIMDKDLCKERVILPKDTFQIAEFDDYIGAYTEKFFFKIPFNKDSKKRPNYIFVNETGHIRNGIKPN